MKRPNMMSDGMAAAESNVTADRSVEAAGTTGRHIVTFRQGALEEGIKTLEDAGLRVAVSEASSPNVLKEEDAGDADAIVFPVLGVAVVGGAAEQVLRLKNVASDSASPLLNITPEKIRHALSYPASVVARDALLGNGASEYLRGYRSAVVHLESELIGYGIPVASKLPLSREVFDETNVTWGLQATAAAASRSSGRGMKVAVLDTGFDFDIDANGSLTIHPDFTGRDITTHSFVTGAATAKDGHGHGTHCIGTACGPRQPPTLPRYGIAYESSIFVGKVLDDRGSGADAWIIAGIEWAVKNGCQVVSMSLGSAKSAGETFDQGYENVARRALDAGTLIVAAAGNESERPDDVEAVDGPADCPSIMAVAAIDSDFQVASFSNGGINPNGGEVDIAAPGVSVYSAFLRPTLHTRKSGTSMATPHVAGIAALYAQSSGARGRDLWKLLTGKAKSLSFPSREVGAGVIQAP